YALLGRNERINVYTGTGNAPSVAAGRLAYWLGLQGPVMTLDTACSSSLVAVHQACQSLRLGECSLALAGGVNLILSPEVNIYFCQLQALAPDGRCKSFDAGADGFVRSEGGGLVLLKRLSDALRDQDPILGLVRGSAVNHDGPSNGLTAPNGRAQQQVIRQALRQAGVAAEAVSFVETHGTGTPLGDPIEVQALEQVMLRSDRVTPLNLGALKSNLGHLESAAGVAGLIKTLLALKHRTLPANLHFQQLNPRIEADPRLHFPSTATPWTSATPRLAGISSFGISGTNAHLILEEYSEPEPIAAEGPGMEHQDYPITLSAHSEVALIARLGQTLDWLSQSKTELNLLRDLAFTTTQRRDHLRHRWALSARDPDALSGALSAALDAGAADLIGPLNDPLIGFVFPGQGAQWPGMGRELFAREAVFREAIARCEAAFAAEVDWRLSEVLETATAEDYARMELIQPVIFAIQVGLSALWQSWGLRPQIVIGHSMGEVAAAYLAGALSLEDAARIICRRSRLLGQQSQQSAGGMLFTALTPAACEAYLSKEIMIGVYNGPDATVLTGERQALEDLAQTLADQEIFARFVQVPVAAHSWQIDSFEAPLKAALAELQPHQPTLRMLSTVTAGPLESPPGPDYWYDNLRQPVRFAQTVEQALAEGVNLWIEISPHPLLLQTLQTSARQAQKPIRTVASLRRDQPEVRTLHQSLLQAYLAGAQPRWEKLAPTAGKVLVLPSYPWQRQSCWLADPAVMSQQAPSPSAMPQAKTVVPQAAPASAATRDAPPIPQQLYQLHWEKSPTPSPQTFPTGPWLIFSDHEALNQSLTLLLQAHGQHCLFVHQGHDLQLGQPPFVLDPLQPDHYLQLMQHLNRHLKRPVNGVIFAWPGRSESPEARGFSPAQAETAYSALQHLLQQLEELAGPPPRLYLVSRGAWQPAGLDPGLSLAQSVWWGLGRSAFYEYPQWHCTQIDLSPSPSPAELQLLAAEVLARSPESNVLIRGGDRLLARLEPYRQTPEAAPESAPQPSSRLSRLLKRKRAEAASLPASCFNILPDASYLISGGLGELGLETARWLARHGARHLVLIGRSGAATPVQAEAVAELQSQGVQVEIPTVDVADSDALKAVLERIRSNLPPLRGVIHAAGVLRDGLIANQTPEAVRTVFQPKIAGAWHLHQLTLADPLDFFICYSSITAPLGMPGQANYAAANSFLDALMEYRRSLGKPALSIDWGPWYRAEVAALATATAAVPASKRLMLAQFGFHWLEREKGFALLERLLRDQAAHASVMALDLGRFLQALPQTRNLPLLATLAREQGQKLSLRPPHILPKRSPGPPTQPNADQPASTVPLPDPAELERFLLQAIARILSVSPTEINTQTSLRGYGFDSLMALELKAQLQDAYGITLKASERYQSMSIAEMSERIGGS
ncbi:MAG: SDR family NAD(P)-dependent oxidoreductase, partial [Candidatus Sericytochromatia bacterium]